MSYPRIEILRANSVNKGPEIFDIKVIVSEDGEINHDYNFPIGPLIKKIKDSKYRTVIIEPWNMNAEYLALLMYHLHGNYDMKPELVKPIDEDEYGQVNDSVKLTFTLKILDR